jgi:Ca-activated chloride channel family protein
MIVRSWKFVARWALFGLGLAVVALACRVDPATTTSSDLALEPTVEPTPTVEPLGNGGPVMLALDTSLSMLADDAEPTRFGGAQQAVSAFLDEAPADLPIGLVSFHGIATLQVAPTTDRAVIRSTIANLELDEATAVGEAIFTGLESLQSFSISQDAGTPLGQIVVVSDGAAINEAQLAGVPVSTIVFGTDAGVIPVPESDVPVPVPINEEALALIAEGTGGEFFAATTTPELVEILTAIAERLG